MNAKKIAYKCKDVEWKEIEGEVLVFEPEKYFFFRLNSTASFIWKKINGKSSFKEISQATKNKYKLKDGQAKKDLFDCIKKLKDLKLIYFK
ncbi:MAG: PqqD family protein [Candidatus Diapherotrites archaeon]